MILEGLVTTVNQDGSANLAPMGPLVEPELTKLTLRPFRTAQTFLNLQRTGAGVFHVTDDVELIAQAAINQHLPQLRLITATKVPGFVVMDACRAYEFVVDELDDSQDRTTICCHVVEKHWFRDFLGFNRAKHAVLEATILATRIGILPADQIRAELERLASPVDKTAGPAERRAFAMLLNHINQRLQ